jgi:hypothetical protein
MRKKPNHNSSDNVTQDRNKLRRKYDILCIMCLTCFAIISTCIAVLLCTMNRFKDNGYSIFEVYQTEAVNFLYTIIIFVTVLIISLKKLYKTKRQLKLL